MLGCRHSHAVCDRRLVTRQSGRCKRASLQSAQSLLQLSFTLAVRSFCVLFAPVAAIPFRWPLLTLSLSPCTDGLVCRADWTPSRGIRSIAAGDPYITAGCGACQPRKALAGLSPDARAALIALTLTNAFARYSPVRQGPSLRLAAFGSDSTLSAYSASSTEQDDATAGEGGSGSTLSASSSAALIASFVVIAFLPWSLYRFLPDRVVTYLDQYNVHHTLRIGEAMIKAPTQFGAVVSWSFLWIALLVAILLGTQSNTQTAVKLLPPSASSLAGSAAANWQLTLRVFSGESAAAMALWCTASASTLLSKQTGFTAQFTPRAQLTAATATSAASCDIAADCGGCGISSVAQAVFTLPYSAQLIEWEVWVSSAEPDAWLRRYGVLAALPGRLMAAESALTFSALESFYSDDRSSFGRGSAGSFQQSGFELNFLSLAPTQPQASFTAASSVGLTFTLNKADVLLRTRLTDKQTPLQAASLIASVVVSLFSIFAIGFRLIEFHLLKRLGISPGEVKPKQATGLAGASDSAAEADGSAASDLSGITLSPLHAARSPDSGLEMQPVSAAELGSPSAPASDANWSHAGHAHDESARL